MPSLTDLDSLDATWRSWCDRAAAPPHERMIPRIGTEAQLATHWRAVAWGGVIGARLSRDSSARFEALFARTADDLSHHDPEWRFRGLDDTVEVFRHRAPPSASNVEAFIGLARSFDERLRRLALENLITYLVGALPVGRMLARAAALFK